MERAVEEVVTCLGLGQGPSRKVGGVDVEVNPCPEYGPLMIRLL